MNDSDAVSLIAEVCVAEGRSLGHELRNLPQPYAKEAAAAADQGALREALRIAGVDEDVAAMGALWPSATRVTSELLARLPSTARLLLPLVQVAGYLLIVVLVQAVVIAVVRRKALAGVMGQLLEAELAPPLLVWDLAVLVAGLGVVGLFVYAVVAMMGLKGMPGWGRALARAREATLLAALVQTNAPSEVVTSWLGRASLLRPIGPHVSADDALLIARDCAVHAEAGMTRVVSTVRIVGFGVLALIALGITLDVYRAVAALSHVQ
jgi:hypothetical protein